MPNTEDVAEKIADILADQTPRAANFLFEISKSTAKNVGSMTQEALDKLLQSKKHDKEMEKWLNLTGEILPTQMNEIIQKLGMRSSTIRVTNSDAPDLESILKEQGVLYAKLNMSKDDGCSFVFLDKDRDKVQDSVSVLLARRGRVTEMPANMYLNHMAPENVQTISGLDNVEATLFRHYARRQQFLFTVIPQDQGRSNIIVFDRKDKEKARRALLQSSWDLTGANGALYRKQVEYHLEGHNKIRFSIEDAQKELYVVSKERPDTFIHITEEDYSLYKSGKKVSRVPRTHPEFDTRCYADCAALPGGVAIDPNDFRQGLHAEDMLDMPTINLHVSNFDEELERSRVTGLINLIAEKETVDDENHSPWGLADPSISYSEFSGFEFIMDADERKAREYEFEHFKQAAFYGKDRIESRELQLDQKSVDYIIAKAEEKRREGLEQAQERTGAHTHSRHSTNHTPAQDQSQAEHDEPLL